MTNPELCKSSFQILFQLLPNLQKIYYYSKLQTQKKDFKDVIVSKLITKRNFCVLEIGSYNIENMDCISDPVFKVLVDFKALSSKVLSYSSRNEHINIYDYTGISRKFITSKLNMLFYHWLESLIINEYHQLNSQESTSQLVE